MSVIIIIYTYRHDLECGGVWISTLSNTFDVAPVVIAWQGRRILQDQTTGAFLGPITLRADGKTLELNANTSADNWEISARLFVVALNTVSHHLYRNLIATGSLNDDFNLHGEGMDIGFENIAAYNKLDEGFSAHDTINCTINGARFWTNDNGFANVNSCVTSATNLLIHDNIGYGLWLSDNTTSNLTNIRVWNNGAVQIRLDNRAAGTATRVSAWTTAWNTPPWRRYKESITFKTSIALGGNAAYTPVPFWTGSLEIVTVPAAPRTYQPNEHHSCARRNNVDSKRRYHRSPTCSSSSWYPSTHGSNWH
ncbi:unnamed protein product [Rotaria socialis]|uniref:Uncharacterized protein n=2 Tax=Rotaria socialis TaxID=392032 RepID=A0A821BWP2_9BILA|nr:unnamed protein product [Rotaria socialis]